MRRHHRRQTRARKLFPSRVSSYIDYCFSDVAAPPKKNIPVEEPSLEGTKEVVVAELQLLASDTLSGVTYNTERVMCLLKVTFQDHCQHYVTLCEVISWEKISSRQLCAEAQLRFESTVDELEVRLKKAAQVFSEQQGQDTSLVQISRHLQGSLDHFLITETALPTAVQIITPHVYTYKNQSWIYGGTQAEVIALKNKNIEWAVIVCLLVYYLKNLSYMHAFLQTLILVQKLLRPQVQIPPGVISNRLKCFLARSKKKNCPINTVTKNHPGTNDRRSNI
ncbi:uncharacterized protein LOC144115419 isoform X2 [Amblyomma americanum]